MPQPRIIQKDTDAPLFPADAWDNLSEDQITRLSPRDFAAFVTELERPARINPRLRQLMAEVRAQEDTDA